MTAPYIDRLIVEQFGCIQSLEMPLTPLHALVGPNDSGKSTILRALYVATRAGSPSSPMGDGPKKSGEVTAGLLEPRSSIHIRLGFSGVGESTRLFYDMKTAEGGVVEEFLRLRSGGSLEKVGSGRLLVGQEMAGRLEGFRDALKAPLFLRLEPSAMRQPGPQLVAEQPIAFMDERGTGLAAVLQAINSRDVDAFVNMRDRARKLFPRLATIRLPTLQAGQVKLQAELQDKRVVEAGAISDGLLYFLAYAAMQYLAPTHLALVEEPENGLHPARVAEIVGLLRTLSESCQVVIATHSPLVINELHGDEVSIITRDAQSGTRATRLSDAFNYAERSKTMANGELWLAYGNDKDEAGLLKKPERAP